MVGKDTKFTGYIILLAFLAGIFVHLGSNFGKYIWPVVPIEIHTTIEKEILVVNGKEIESN